jgi:glycosyltransferase involved in cell wall biosynthesis
MNKVAHIIHNFQVGGVENGVRHQLLNGGLNYKVFCLGTADSKYISGISDELLTYRKVGESRLLYFIKLIRNLYNFRPDVIISSLWRSHILGIILSTFSSFKWYPFYHSSQVFHKPDLLSLYLSVFLSRYALCDSVSTSEYIISVKKIETKIVLYNFPPTFKNEDPLERFTNRFLYCGRLSSVKNIAYLLEIIKNLNNRAEFHLDIYGEGESRDELLRIVVELGIASKVHFKGVVAPEEIDGIMLRYKFYIQTSLFEGRAVSVSQAMNAGCCCFTSFVGEIDNYATDNFNAIRLCLNDIDVATRRIYETIMSYDKYTDIALMASKTFIGEADYSESFESAIDFLIESRS